MNRLFVTGSALLAQKCNPTMANVAKLRLACRWKPTGFCGSAYSHAEEFLRTV